MKKNFRRLTTSIFFNLTFFFSFPIAMTVISSENPFKQLNPISKLFGFDRGTPLDRYYIEKFLAQYQADIKGSVLEVGDDRYTKMFGKNRVTKSSILHLTGENPQTTIIADLTNAAQIPSNSFDCIILTQVLPHIYDVKSTIKTIYRILKSGGIVLATVPGINKISQYDIERWGDYWRFTHQSIRLLFEETFSKNSITVETYGNVFVASSFLYGLAAQDLKQEELDYKDPDYQVSITVRAIK